MKRRVADTNPARIDPTRDVRTATLEDVLLAQTWMVQTDELEDLPQAMRILRQIAEEVGLTGIEGRYHLTRIRRINVQMHVHLQKRGSVNFVLVISSMPQYRRVMSQSEVHYTLPSKPPNRSPAQT
jgi:hypothetical protein